MDENPYKSPMTTDSPERHEQPPSEHKAPRCSLVRPSMGLHLVPRHTLQCWLLAVLIAFVGTRALHAQDESEDETDDAVVAIDGESAEVPLPIVTVIQPPRLPRIAEEELSAKRQEETDELIGKLSGLKERDIGLLRSPIWGDAFLPVGDFSHFGERQAHPFNSLPALQRLVEIGPDALPRLLENLENDAPTQLVIQAVKTEGAISGGMAFDEFMHGNPANPAEQAALSLDRRCFSASIRPDDESPLAGEIESYRVKVGDVCFAAIGQIVGRRYDALAMEHVKSLGVLICSPVHRPEMRDKVRRIWSTKNPRQKLFESLLFDFSTRGLLQNEDDALDDWDIGSDFQVNAAMRLLYYFPEESAAIIADRVASLDVTTDYLDACLKNGVRTDDFIEAVSWSKHKRIHEALEELVRKATEKEAVRALERASFKNGAAESRNNSALDRARGRCCSPAVHP